MFTQWTRGIKLLAPLFQVRCCRLLLLYSFTNLKIGDDIVAMWPGHFLIDDALSEAESAVNNLP